MFFPYLVKAADLLTPIEQTEPVQKVIIPGQASLQNTPGKRAVEPVHINIGQPGFLGAPSLHPVGKQTSSMNNLFRDVPTGKADDASSIPFPFLEVRVFLAIRQNQQLI